MTVTKFEIGKCPLHLSGCRGLKLLKGEEAKRYLGPFARPESTAVVCGFHADPNAPNTVEACDGTVQGNLPLTEDVPA